MVASALGRWLVGCVLVSIAVVLFALAIRLIEVAVSLVPSIGFEHVILAAVILFSGWGVGEAMK